jgi:hypothetical protein
MTVQQTERPRNETELDWAEGEGPEEERPSPEQWRCGPDEG